MELSQIYSWQLIFFSGLTVGFYWQQIRAWWSTISLPIRKILITSVVSLSVITMLACFLLAYGTDLLGLDQWFKQTFDALYPTFAKEPLYLPRLLLFALWFSAAFWLFWRFEKFIIRWAGWLFMSFGTNSLYVYTIQAFLVFFLHLIVPSATPSIALNLLLSVLGVAVVWLALRTRFLMKIIPR
jgi:hypothetical protein